MSVTMAIPTTRAAESSAQTSTSIWRVGAAASIAGACAAELCSLVARAIDVPMVAADPGADSAKHIAVGGFAIATLMWAAVGTILAVVLARRAENPARTFAVTTIALTVLSIAGPVLAAHTEKVTKIVLVLAHAVAASVIIPPLTQRLAHVRD